MEERNTGTRIYNYTIGFDPDNLFSGAISVDVYKNYIRAGNGYIIVPLLLLALALIQGVTVMSSYWCVMVVLQSPMG